jgi:hypothetical protein
MIKYLKRKLYKFLFESNWEQMHVDKAIIVMYTVPIVLILCNTAFTYSGDLTP